MLRRSCLWTKAFANIGSFDLSSGKILCLNCRITASKRSRLSGGVPGPKRFFCSKSAPLTDKDPAASPVKVEKQADVSSSGASSPTPGGAVAGGGIGSTLSYANETYHDFERKLMARIKESNQRRFRAVLALVVGLVSWVVFVFGARLRKLLTDHTAGLAKETLENESLKIQTQELAMAVVQTILNDQDTAAHAAAFLREAASNEETKAALVGLALHILQHPDTLSQLGQLSQQLLRDLCADKETRQLLTQLGVAVLQDEQVRAAAAELLVQVARDPIVLEATTALALQVFAAGEVNNATYDLLVRSSSEVLQDEKVIAQSRGFVADVVGDAALQKEGGHALWHSVTYALQPGIIRMAGFGIVCVSAAVLKIFLSPY